MVSTYSICRTNRLSLVLVFGCPGKLAGIRTEEIVHSEVSYEIGLWSKDPMNPSFVYYYSPSQNQVSVSAISILCQFVCNSLVFLRK